MKNAIANITAAAPTTPALTPGAVTEPGAPSGSTVVSPAAPIKLPSPAKQGDSKTPAPKDLKADALAALQKAVDALLAAVTSGDVGQVVPAVTGVLTALVNFLAATLLGGGLPAANLPGLPTLPLPLPVG
ncbi:MULTISPECIES: hypothetical protein [unclassified Streptomyces]|uniref:hypothetical protein n=1 Tax=unclassified Streptomyces TaxID=2593676 RepID=UPI00224D1EEE|nr:MULTISPECIES: hypothetical protein [unclassified Streptomyces]MCX5056964.1 hypothetical protein [Streptomyces sp. NBC_00452]MCX5288056.1 hypothetical protein [Streptomyces sp. NBC_00183]